MTKLTSSPPKPMNHRTGFPRGRRKPRHLVAKLRKFDCAIFSRILAHCRCPTAQLTRRLVGRLAAEAECSVAKVTGPAGPCL